MSADWDETVAVSVIAIAVCFFLCFGVRQCTDYHKHKSMLFNGYHQTYDTNAGQIMWQKPCKETKNENSRPGIRNPNRH